MITSIQGSTFFVEQNLSPIVRVVDRAGYLFSESIRHLLNKTFSSINIKKIFYHTGDYRAKFFNSLLTKFLLKMENYRAFWLCITKRRKDFYAPYETFSSPLCFPSFFPSLIFKNDFYICQLMSQLSGGC